MQSFLQENINFLRVIKPEVVMAVQKLPEGPVSEAKNPGDGIRLRFGEGNWYPSSPSIPHYVDQVVGQPEAMTKDGKMFVVGFGLGYVAEALVNRVDPSVELIFWEPNLHLFRLAMQYRDLRPIFRRPNVQIQLGDVAPAINYLLSNTTMRLTNIRLVVDKELNQIGPVYQEELTKKILPVVRTHQVNQTTIKNFGQIFLDNALKNVVFYPDCEQTGSLAGLGAGLPAIIIGSGPSLSSQYEHLRNARSRAIFICADSALRGLLANDVIPDIVVTVDPQERTASKLEDLEGLPKSKQPFVLFHPFSNHNFLQEIGYPKIITGSSGPFWELFAPLMPNAVHLDKNIHCQMHMAANAAEYLECKPIIIVGMDLCYKNNTYSDPSCAYHNQTEIMETVSKGKAVEGVAGTVKSSDIFLDYAFLMSLRAMPDAYPYYFNTATEGLPMGGIETVELGQLVANMGSGLSVNFKERFLQNPRRIPQVAKSAIVQRLTELKEDYTFLHEKAVQVQQGSVEERRVVSELMRSRKVGLHAMNVLSTDRSMVTPRGWPALEAQGYPYNISNLTDRVLAEAQYAWIASQAERLGGLVDEVLQKLQ